MLDTRFQRTPDTAPDTADKTMLGATQKQWLKNSLATSTAAWKIIVSTVSANKHSRPGNIDHWGSFVTEANELKDFLAADPNLADSTVMVTGDLHSGGGIGKSQTQRSCLIFQCTFVLKMVYCIYRWRLQRPIRNP